ncbi:phytanoyl-CoA dioxygenase family protein [Luteolibacter sp. GHJ8]|uniref:Phytanoyl-CoA dioxygenase family protein n=1 Tax=Luteolibacter rhizosphaerae TaxID=2989719 RepID=A0ABT3G988_9BACT|nr:phytanoyl-CoA dioxygenase family protein [Luteolibacter rhizosphaerae]MCW1916413.1 phytanoyl-CoA dioxygenase family protein [Luteolibacter rhizosphaerae]
MSPIQELANEGWTRVSTGISPELQAELRATLFAEGLAGTRCLLDLPPVAAMAKQLKVELTVQGLISGDAVAIQAIAFDKTPGTNWKVAWHQDLMFPFARPVTAPGYDLPVRKGGVDYARPPLRILEELLAVRLHLDPCGPNNGPLRVCPGSHHHGFIPSQECGAFASTHGEYAALAEQGEVILMRPLLLHASSQATEPGHRRVLHLVYHGAGRAEEPWHRSVR